MDHQESNLERITRKLSTTALVMSAGLLFFLRPLALPGVKVILRLIKLIVTAFSRVTSWIAIASAAMGIIVRSPTAFVAGVISFVVSVGYYRRIPPPPPDEPALPAPRDEQHHYIATSPIIHRSVTFAYAPGEKGAPRPLLCDVWLPAKAIQRSNTVIINLHGGAWHSLNKGFLTGTQFRHLCMDGHSVVDVAYRLYPETDMRGMLDDVQQAIAWVKQDNAGYNLNAAHIILMGSSAGGHLALQHAFTANDPAWLANACTDHNLCIDGVIAFYPPVDLRAYLAYSPGGLAPGLLGGTPEQVPEMYERYSPLYQVHPGCPPTLILQGAHDYVVPVEPVRELNRRLIEAGCDSTYIEYPANEHGFDLFLPNISPAAKSAMGHVRRFVHKIGAKA